MAGRGDFVCNFAIDSIDFDTGLVVESFVVDSLYACCQQILLEAVKVNSFLSLRITNFYNYKLSINCP